jgi:hypothetical protein
MLTMIGNSGAAGGVDTTMKTAAIAAACKAMAAIPPMR